MQFGGECQATRVNHSGEAAGSRAALGTLPLLMAPLAPQGPCVFVSFRLDLWPNSNPTDAASQSGCWFSASCLGFGSSPTPDLRVRRQLSNFIWCQIVCPSTRLTSTQVLMSTQPATIKPNCLCIRKSKQMRPRLCPNGSFKLS